MNFGGIIGGLGTVRLGQQQGRKQRQDEEAAKQEQIKQMMFKLALEESARRQTQANADRDYGLRQTESERRLAAEARAAQKEAFAESQARAPVLGTPEYLQAQTGLEEMRQKFAKSTAPVYGSPEYLKAVDMVEGVRDRHQKSGSGDGGGTQETTLPDGTVVQGKPPKVTDGQRQNAMYLEIAEQAANDVDKLNPSITAKQVGRIPIIGNTLLSHNDKEYQLYNRAANQFLSAIVYAQTGKAATSQEIEKARVSYIPEPGDSDTLRESKNTARRGIMDAIRHAAGAAASPARGASSGETPAQAAFKAASMRLQQQYDNAVAQGANPRMAQAVLDREMTKLRKGFNAR